MWQAGLLSIQTPFLLRKMLVGLCPIPFILHRSDAGCAFFQNASIYIRWSFKTFALCNFDGPSQTKRTASNSLNGKWGHNAGCSAFRSKQKAFDIFASSWYTTSNPCESVGGGCVAFPVLSCS